MKIDGLRCESDLALFEPATIDRVEAAVKTMQRNYRPYYLCIQLLICFFGIITNIIHILVLNRPSMRSSSVMRILRAVAFADLGTMTSSFVIVLWFQILNRHDSKSCSPGTTIFNSAILLLNVFIAIFLHSLSLWLVVAMAMVREMTLRSPRPGSKWLRANCAKKLMRFMTFAVLLLCTPSVFMHSIKKIYPSPKCNLSINDSQPGYILSTTEFIKETGCWPLKIHLWIFGVSCKVTPCLLLLVLSITLVMKVRQQGKDRERKFSASSETAKSMRRMSVARDRRTTNSLISVIVVFLVTELPQGVITILSAIYTIDVYFHVYIWVGDLLDLLSLINSSVNFLIYCLTSSVYRQAFWITFGSVFGAVEANANNSKDTFTMSRIDNERRPSRLSQLNKEMHGTVTHRNSDTNLLQLPDHPPRRKVSFACDGDDALPGI